MVDVIRSIADLQPEPKPNPESGIGRECYAFSDTEDRAFQLLRDQAEALFERYGVSDSDYHVENDAIGNLYVTLCGKNRQETVMSGSHLDSVYRGGMYDGVAGVHSAFRLLERLLAEGKSPVRNYSVAVFRSEESSPKTGTTSIGSRVATGTLKEADLIKIPYVCDDGTTVPFPEFFSKKYGESRWNEVLHEIQHPPLTGDTIVAYEELHIEQSAVCDLNDADVGIVVDGIGGAIREKVLIPLDPAHLRTCEVSDERPHTRCKLLFVGEEAHSGGTPPNPDFQRKNGDSLLYRRDALIGAARFVLPLMLSDSADGMKVVGFGVPREVGFTTVPKEQYIEMLVPDHRLGDFERFVAQMGDVIDRQFGVKLKVQEREKAGNGKFHYYDPAVFETLQIPLIVEQAVREKCNGQILEAGGGVGKVRGTVTDFIIGTDVPVDQQQAPRATVRCNLDFRDVDPVAIADVRRQVHQRIIGVMRNVMEGGISNPLAFHVVKTLSSKPYTPLYPQAVEDKVRIAGGFGYKVMKMPSLPGHDAASFGPVGVPVSMTFVRHDGRSHTGYETMPAEYYEKAERVSHRYLAEKLGVELSDGLSES